MPLQVVSYAKFLYPTNALVAHKTDGHSLPPQARPSIPRALLGPRHKPAPTKPAPAGPELGSPHTLTTWRGPEAPRGRQTRVTFEPKVLSARGVGLRERRQGWGQPLRREGGPRQPPACASPEQAVERTCVHR